MENFRVNQTVRLRTNAKCRSWFPSDGEGGLWIAEVLANRIYKVFDGQWTFDLPETDLERGDPNNDITYFKYGRYCATT